MSSHARPGLTLPTGSIEWLIADHPQQALSLSGSGTALRLLAAGHQTYAVDKVTTVVAQLSAAGATAVVAEAESLPFDPCLFDVVWTHQGFHHYAPGLVLSEMARVLKPGGHAAVSYLVRDDSVPWVKRLLAHVQALDSSAMAGQYGTASVDELLVSKYFPRHEHREFRHWVPITRAQLVQMVAALPACAGLDEADREDFLGGVRALYDSVAPGAGDLRLPYQLRCWKAWVDHQELTAPIEVADGALVIPL